MPEHSVWAVAQHWLGKQSQLAGLLGGLQALAAFDSPGFVGGSRSTARTAEPENPFLSSPDSDN